MSETVDDRDIKINTLANILKPLIYIFVDRILVSFKKSLPDGGEKFSVGPDLKASRVGEDFVYLNNWTIQLDNSTDERANKLLAIKIYDFLSNAGYSVSGNWGQGFDLKISREDFEKMISNDGVVGAEISSIREQLSL